MKSRLKIHIAASAICLALILTLWYLLDRSAGAADLDRLLAGDQSITIKKLQVEAQQRELVCSDLEVLAFFSSVFRKSETNSGGGGTYYRFNFEFSTGRSYCVVGGFDKSGLSLSVPNAHPTEPEWPTHNFAIPAAVPSRVNEVLDFLDAPWEEVAGLSLNVATDSPFIYRYNPSLHGANPAGTRVAELAP